MPTYRMLPGSTGVIKASVYNHSGMIDWGYYKVGMLEFVRDDGLVVGLWWQWDEYDYPGLWVKVGEGISEEQIKRVTEKFGRFRKSRA